MRFGRTLQVRSPWGCEEKKKATAGVAFFFSGVPTGAEIRRFARGDSRETRLGMEKLTEGVMIAIQFPHDSSFKRFNTVDGSVFYK
jgi:hypothetical protein